MRKMLMFSWPEGGDSRDEEGGGVVDGIELPDVEDA